MIPVSKPSTTKLEVQYVNEALSKNDIGVGEFIPRFEKAWSEINDIEYGVSVNSGTSALLLALKVLGVGPGDEVIVPDLTMAACGFVVSYLGATPIFVDCDESLNIDPTLIERKISDKTKVIMVVHIYGRRAKMEQIKEIANKYTLPIVEDLAEGHGIMPSGDIACYSFYGNKIISTGEGGMCLTNSEELKEKMLFYKSMCFDKDRTFFHSEIGYNMRLTNIQAALGLAQTERIGEILRKRNQIQSLYSEKLDPEYLRPKREVLWMYDIDTDKPKELHDFLYEKGIDTRYVFKQLSSMPMWYKEDINPIASKQHKKGLQLPTYTDLTEEEITYIVEQVNSFGG